MVPISRTPIGSGIPIPFQIPGIPVGFFFRIPLLKSKTDKSKRRIVGFRWERKLQPDRPHTDREVVLRKTNFNFFFTPDKH